MLCRMLLSAVWLLLLVGEDGVLAKARHPCYASEHHRYQDMGSKTSYHHIYNKNGIPSAPGCEPVQLWMFGRHGTRNPAKKQLLQLDTLGKLRDKIVINYYKNLSALCKSDIKNLQEWSYNLTESQGNQLTMQGRLDLFGIGRRLASYFPQLLNHSYTPENFIIQHSDTSRTQESAEYFAKGFFGKRLEYSISHSPEHNHFIMNYNYCGSWHGRKVKEQQAVFDESAAVRSLISRVSKRLGFRKHLSILKVTNMYNMCRFNLAWNISAVSPWCAVFNIEELKMMEYREDLMFYYYNGPGDQINKRLACPLIRHMFTQFSVQDTKYQKDHPHAFFLFGHENMIGMLDYRLGFSPVKLPLKGNNYDQQTHRTYQSSKISPFAANIIAVLYRCSDNQLKVMFLRSEHPVMFPGCKELLCDWARVRRILAPIVLEPACTDNSYCTKRRS